MQRMISPSKSWAWIVLVAHLLSSGGCQSFRKPHLPQGSNEPTSAKEVDPQDLLFEAEQAMQRGDHLGAEARYRRVLALQEQADGHDATSVAGILNDLASVYYAQDRYAEAEPLMQRALAIYEQRFGAEDPNVAASLNNLANLYRNQGQFDKAEPLYLRALRIQQKTVGAEDPDAIRTRKNLEALRKAQSNDGTLQNDAEHRPIRW